MNKWISLLNQDPIPILLAKGNEPIRFFVHRDILNFKNNSFQQLWELPEPQKILKKQLPDGSWPRSDKVQHLAVKHQLFDTWRAVNDLVGKYCFNQEHPQIAQAIEYLFSCQTQDGDFRGIMANQYATYYTGAILATIIQAGYQQDPRVDKCFQWLHSMRQDDGGWSIPMITHKFDRRTQYKLQTENLPSVEPDRSKPFSHNWTGMVLRAFAEHPKYRQLDEIKLATELLKSRFFQADVYSSLQDARYWLRFEYPFWWNNLVSAMDIMVKMGMTLHDPQIDHAINWLIEHQQPDGLWKVNYYSEVPEKSNNQIIERKLWVSLAICRIFKDLEE